MERAFQCMQGAGACVCGAPTLKRPNLSSRKWSARGRPGEKGPELGLMLRPLKEQSVLLAVALRPRASISDEERLSAHYLHVNGYIS